MAQPKKTNAAEDYLFFRLRIPKRLGDMIADQAWQGRRSVNSQVLLLLEQAVGWEGPSLVVETPAGRGAKAAGQQSNKHDAQLTRIESKLDALSLRVS